MLIGMCEPLHHLKVSDHCYESLHFFFSQLAFPAAFSSEFGNLALSLLAMCFFLHLLIGFRMYFLMPERNF